LNFVIVFVIIILLIELCC